MTYDARDVLVRADALEEAARICDDMVATSPRKQYQEAAAWLADRIRARSRRRAIAAQDARE